MLRKLHSCARAAYEVAQDAMRDSAYAICRRGSADNDVRDGARERRAAELRRQKAAGVMAEARVTG